VAGGLRPIGIMLRLRSICVMGSFGPSVWALSGCFGLVEYDVHRGVGEAGAPSGGAGIIPVPAASGGSFSSGGASSGGANSEPRGSGGVLSPVEPPRKPPPEDEPSCTVDCCPEALAQLTGTTSSGPLDADVVRPYLSGDGNWVVFGSRATSLPGAGAHGFEEVYLSSLADGGFVRIASAHGAVPNGDTEANALSADGRFVLLTSSSTHFSPLDQNAASDVFLYDRSSAEFALISRGLSGGAGNGRSLGRDLSPDGRYAVYSSAASDLTADDDNGGWDVFVWDRHTGATERVSMGPGDQQRNPVSGNHAHISADGRFVSFHSQSDLLALEPNGGAFDVFLFDRQLGSTLQVSRTPSGGAPDGNTFVLGMSDDARFLASYGSATNLVDDDANGQSDVFLFDRALGATRRVNVGPSGQEADSGTTNVSMSHDGARLSFTSASAQLGADGGGLALQSYSYDTTTGQLTRLSQGRSAEPGNADSYPAEFSTSGRCFVFSSRATNLTSLESGDFVSDLFVGRSPPSL
jgi:Tol biopolymer transport system component